MSLPLEGIKIVEIAQVYLGPGAAAHLADQGAEVIKVETLRGDSLRSMRTSPYLERHGLSYAFLALNRNKRSIALDMHSPAGQSIVHELVKRADVCILNLRPKAAAALHLDYDTLSSLNPRLIYAAISAYGSQGPEASAPGYDIVIQSRSGAMGSRPPGIAPVPSPITIADLPGSLSLAFAIMTALWERQSTQRGQRIDISLLHTALAMQMNSLVWVTGEEKPARARLPNALATCYQCADGLWLTVVAVENRQWEDLCEVLELPNLAKDPRFGSYEARLRAAPELFEIMGAVFQTGRRDEWIARLKKKDVPCTAVAEPIEVPEDPQVVANRMLCEQYHPALGCMVKTVAAPFQLSSTDNEPISRRPAPLLGQDTKEILSELGYDSESILRLERQGLVHWPKAPQNGQ